MPVDPVNPYRSSPPPQHTSFSSQDDIDKDPAFIQLVDANWEAIDQYRKDPSQLNIQALMQATNHLNAYLKTHVPTQSANPKAYDIYQALNKPVAPHSASLATICEDYDTSNRAATVDWFRSEFEDAHADHFSDLYDKLNVIGSQRTDKDNATVKDDFYYLMNDLKAYNSMVASKHYNPDTLKQLMADIMADIKKLNADAKGVTDGYLTTVLTLINTPITTDANAPSLLDLASKSPPDYDAISKAFAILGETGGKGDLSNLLDESEKNEYPS